MSDDYALTQFWSRVDRKRFDECWPWIGYISPSGYGRFMCNRVSTSPLQAHRFAYEQIRGRIPDGMVIDHLCRVRYCVNPWHMEVVSNAENIRRGMSGNHNKIKTHCPQGHEYTPESTYYTPSRPNARYCRVCRSERGAAAWERKRRSQMTN